MIGLRQLLLSGLLGLVWLYQQTWGAYMPKRCRFYPSCSQYMKEALQAHGPFIGFWLGVCRLGRCHPWHPGGVDPVPEKGDVR